MTDLPRGTDVVVVGRGAADLALPLWDSSA